jgi:hypothetical protein
MPFAPGKMNGTRKIVHSSSCCHQFVLPKLERSAVIAALGYVARVFPKSNPKLMTGETISSVVASRGLRDLSLAAVSRLYLAAFEGKRMVHSVPHLGKATCPATATRVV